MISRKHVDQWRYLLLLLAVVATVILEPIVFGARARVWLFDAFFSLVLLAAVVALTKQRRGRLLVVLFGAAALALMWSSHAMPGRYFLQATIAYQVVTIAFLVFVTVSVVKSVLGRGQVTLDSVFGCVAGYLILGIAWGLAYSILHIVSPHAFDLGNELPQFVDNPGERVSVFIYYSFATLTTLGFGDVTPISTTARTLSWTEAVSGQLYVATLVAGIVGVVAGQAFERARAREAAGGDRDDED